MERHLLPFHNKGETEISIGLDQKNRPEKKSALMPNLPMDDDETSMLISEKEASMRRDVWWKGMVIDARFVPFFFF